MIWMVFLLSFVWASDPLNNGIVIEEVSIELPSVEPPAVDVSAPIKPEEESKLKPSAQGKDANQGQKKESDSAGASEKEGAEPAYLPLPDQEAESRAEKVNSGNEVEKNATGNP